MTRILQISDPHIVPQNRLFDGRIDTNSALRTMLEGLSAILPNIEPVERIVVSGDLTETGCAAAYAEFMRIMEHAPLPWRAIPGNHDNREEMRAALSSAAWMPSSGPINWREDLGNLTLLGLDTLVDGAAHGALTDESIEWLTEMLNDLNSRPVIVFLHHPPISTGIEVMDNINLKSIGPLEKILRYYPGQIQLCCGHVHRMITGTFAGHQTIIAPGTAHGISCDLRPGAPLRFQANNAGAMLHFFDRHFTSIELKAPDFDMARIVS